MVRRALLVGCNYPGEQCELKGSVNDVERMRILLINRFGFNPNEILELVDTDPHARQPTGANIRKCLRKLIDGVEPGDVLFFHFSGHGTQVPSEWGKSGETGYEECIVPSDMNLLTDDDFRELVDKIPRGATFTFIADACHSGGLIDSEKEQIGDRYSSGGRLRPPGSGRPATGGGGLMELVGEGIEAFASSGGRGRNDPIMNVMGQALGSRFNRMPGDGKTREFDPQEIDAYGRLPESPYDRRYVEGGMPEYPTERPYERRDPREIETSYYEEGASGYPAGYERRETGGSDRPYTGSTYTQKYLKKTPMEPLTGCANETLGFTSIVKLMQSGSSVPETGYAERAFGYPTESSLDGPGSPYSGGYPPEATFGRPVGDDYGYAPRGAYDRPGDDEFGYPPRGTYERPADDDYSYAARPGRPAGVDYGYPARPVRTLEDDYRYQSEGASRRRNGTEDLYVRPEDESYDRYVGGERRQSYARDGDRRRPDRDSYETEHERRGRFGEGSLYEDSPRYPAKYPSEYPGSGGNYGVYPETGERFGDNSLSGDYGYSGKPHHTPLKNKSLPIEMLTDILSRRAGQNVRLSNIHMTLYDLFGDDASPTVKFIVSLLLNKMEDNEGEGGRHGHGLMGKIGGLASQLLKTKLDHPDEEYEKYRRRQRRNYDGGILISACEPRETSADANPTNNPRDAYGALSNAIQTIIGESRGPLTNRQLLMAARKLLSQQGYKQHPCLYCSDRNADALFLTSM